MKKVLLSITAGLLSVTMASAQCTPLATYADSTFGLWPDSIPFVTDHAAFAGQAYSAQIDLKTFVDTSFVGPTGPITATIDAFKILSFTGQPAGFTWSAGGSTWVQADQTWYNEYGTPGNTNTITPVQGCLSMVADAASATAAAPVTGFTDYPLVVSVDARIAKTSPDVSFLIPNGTWLSNPQYASLTGGALEIETYVLRVNAAVGIAEMLSSSKFDVGQNFPNPATGETIITFNTPSSSVVEFVVYNMLGVAVKSSMINSDAGLNEVKFNTSDLSSGMYVYTLRSNGSTITKRMTVK